MLCFGLIMRVFYFKWLLGGGAFGRIEKGLHMLTFTNMAYTNKCLLFVLCEKQYSAFFTRTYNWCKPLLKKQLHSFFGCVWRQTKTGHSTRYWRCIWRLFLRPKYIPWKNLYTSYRLLLDGSLFIDSISTPLKAYLLAIADFRGHTSHSKEDLKAFCGGV